jgi:hypothetical protein
MTIVLAAKPPGWDNDIWDHDCMQKVRLKVDDCREKVRPEVERLAWAMQELRAHGCAR